MRLSLPLIVSSAVLVASAQRVNRSQCRASASSTIASPTSSTPASSSAPASTSSSSPSSSGSPATPNNLASTSTSGALSALLYTSVGSSGSYNMVTQMFPGAYPACSVSPACTYAPRQVSGNLAPFDEPLTVLFRGPMALDNVNVYQPGADGSWGLVSKFAAGQAPQNMVFMNNMGGKASGEWSYCQGASQSYASGDFTSAVSSPNAETFSGTIPSGHEMNIMTATPCSNSTCTGFSRGTANKGWEGSKLVVVQFEMPSSAQNDPPAIWVLNDQVVRSAQYGCNCRGMGAAGGCGELDVMEVLPEKNADQAFSEIYSLKGATGSGDGNYFVRPTSGANVYAVLFDVATDQIAIQHWSSFDFGTGAIPRALVDGYLGAQAKVVSFAPGARKRRAHRRGLLHHAPRTSL